MIKLRYWILNSMSIWCWKQMSSIVWISLNKFRIQWKSARFIRCQKHFWHRICIREDFYWVWNLFNDINANLIFLHWILQTMNIFLSLLLCLLCASCWLINTMIIQLGLKINSFLSGIESHKYCINKSHLNFKEQKYLIDFIYLYQNMLITFTLF